MMVATNEYCEQQVKELQGKTQKYYLPKKIWNFHNMKNKQQKKKTKFENLFGS
jgi:hypothetical protein